VSKWNESVSEYDNFYDALESLRDKRYYLNLFDNKFDITSLQALSTVKFASHKVKGVTLRAPKFYADMNNQQLADFVDVVGMDDGTFRVKNVDTQFQYYLNGHGKVWGGTTTCVLVNEGALSGNIKTYLREKYNGTTLYIRVNRKRKLFVSMDRWSDNSYQGLLKLAGLKKKEWRKHIEEFQLIEQQLLNQCKDETKIEQDAAYITWLEKKKADQKANRKPVVRRTVTKLDDEIVVFEARKAVRGADVVYEKTTKKLCDLPKVGKMVVYCDVNEKPENNSFARAIMFADKPEKVAFYAFNTRDIKHIKDFTNFVTMDKLKETKPFARMATFFYIENLRKYEPPKMDLVSEAMAEMKRLRVKMDKYVSSKSYWLDEEVKAAIIEQAKETGAWDMTIWADIQKYEKEIKKYGFMNLLKDTTSWKTSEVEKEIARNMIYVMLKFQIKEGKAIEESQLVPVKKPAEVTADPKLAKV